MKTTKGYWVKFEYGKWSDGFVSRHPYTDYYRDVETDLEHYSMAVMHCI